MHPLAPFPFAHAADIGWWVLAFVLPILVMAAQSEAKQFWSRKKWF